MLPSSKLKKAIVQLSRIITNGWIRRMFGRAAFQQGRLTSRIELHFFQASNHQDRDVITMKKLLLLSGPMASGKTSVGAALQTHFGFQPISSGGFLRAYLTAQNKPCDRSSLQELGDALDRESDFSWLIDSVAIPVINEHQEIDHWLLDAVRKPRQVELFRLRFGDAVKHVHITAPEPVLLRRYTERGGSEIAQYQLSVLHPNEQSARSLEGVADKVFDSQQHTALEIAHQIMGIWER